MFLGGVLLWAALSGLHVLQHTIFPSPLEVATGFGEIIRNGRLYTDLVASLFRVTLGFLLAVVLSVPCGLWLGHHPLARTAWLPTINFFRNLSPLAWIPFAIAWFHIGDPPAIFLIFMASFFPMLLAVTTAVASIPSVYFQVARDYDFKGLELLTRVTLPAIMPQVITALRVTAGVAWVVVVAAEMIAGRDGLGFAIWDARNGQRSDILVCAMIVIGLIGTGIDQLLARMTRLPVVRWGYER